MAAGSDGAGRKTGIISRLLWHKLDEVRRGKQNHALSRDLALGRHGEDLAHRFLERAGLSVVARNYRPRGGEAEVDLVAKDGGTLVFVEVKTRTNAEFGTPDRAIGAEKQRNIVRAARAFAQRANVSWDAVRFDTISVLMTEPPQIEHTKDAFFLGRTR